MKKSHEKLYHTKICKFFSLIFFPSYQRLYVFFIINEMIHDEKHTRQIQIIFCAITENT
jgi:hypothetical protein